MNFEKRWAHQARRLCGQLMTAGAWVCWKMQELIVEYDDPAEARKAAIAA